MGKAETPPKKITEDSLRRLRLGFVAEQSAELGLSAVVQGHNSGDVAETFGNAPYARRGNCRNVGAEAGVAIFAGRFSLGRFCAFPKPI